MLMASVCSLSEQFLHKMNQKAGKKSNSESRLKANKNSRPKNTAINLLMQMVMVTMIMHQMQMVMEFRMEEMKIIPDRKTEKEQWIKVLLI
ncbi:MAG: hypothetical protein MZV64_06040 [Ignavibacteriales bacterium]|nr:hypothetical protein [Ignavibacteriales bacterium]